MNSIKTVVKFELIRYFLSPLAYVYLISFLLLSGSCAIYFGHFFLDGQANLWGLFGYQPWIYLLFIPSISMRLWAEEFKTKSIIQILTTPVGIKNFVWGKFFASWIFACIAISLTFPFWITVNLLGNPDNTVIFISYLGCFVLAGAMLSISQAMSSLTKSPVIALVMSVFVNLLFFWSGFDYVLFWARELFNDVIVDTIISFSFLTHFSSFSIGLIELRDVIFFASLIVFFNVFTIIVISLKTKGASNLISSSSLKYSFVVFILFFLGFLGLNVIANNTLRQISFDFTEEKYLSLTKNTKNILKKLERPVVAKLYYSPILEKRNPEIRLVFDQIKLLLKQYKAYSNGNFDYRIYNPEFLDKTEDKAIADGLQPIPLIDINQNALFGLTISDNLTNKSVIPFFAMERLPYLEQDLTESIYKLNHKKKTLGILSSIPIIGKQRDDHITLNTWEIINKIGDFYDIKIIKGMDDFNQKFDVFMLIHPHHLDDDLINEIKKQEKVLVLLDVVDDASLLYLPEGGRNISSYLDSLADYWGIDFYDMGVAADFDNSITVDETIDYSKNPSFTQDLLQFKVTEADFNPNHRISRKLKSILFSTASAILPRKTSDVIFSPLIKTSNNSALLNVDFAKKRKHPREILEKYEPGEHPLILAGEFLSNNPNYPFDVIAVADTDFIYDDFWAKKQSFMNNDYFVPLFDSANFILNSLDYLTENDDLINLRGKTIKKRPLYKIEDIRKKNTYAYKIKEKDIFEAIDIVKSNLLEITAKKSFENRETFNADELAIIGDIRKNIDDLRQRLSDLRRNANKNLYSLETKVKFFNIYFISLIIICLLLILTLKNKQFSMFKVKDVVFLDKNILKLFTIVLLILILASVTVYIDNRNTISKYENKLVLNDFNSKINNITTITLKDKSNTLVFKKNKGLWILENYPEIPVYQERIRNFLFTLSNMTFQDKKSDKIEDMKYFGFSPLDNKNSEMIEVYLNDANNNTISRFDVGWYDIDLGRGSRGAFIRLDNKFQIWLVDADFYDLNLDKYNWIYSTLWNLRFGRFIKYNNISDENKIMNIVKNMLNINFKNIVSDISGNEIGKINVLSENNNNIELVFYKTPSNKYFVKYNFINLPNGDHLEFFAKFIENKYLEISEIDWEKIKNDTDK